jgi:tripartite-type tricarboxylate transporter receptor subunit TctC
VQDRLSAVLKAASETPEVRDGLANQGAAANWTSPAEFGETIARESAIWKRIAEAANIRTD